MSTRSGILLALVAVVFAVPGCGSNGSNGPPALDFGSEDGKKIAELVSDLNEAKATAQKFKTLFVAPAPSNWKTYEALNFDVVGKPKVDGTQATAKVKIRSDADQAEKGEKEWAFAKEGDKWKIKSAPLP